MSGETPYDAEWLEYDDDVRPATPAEKDSLPKTPGAGKVEAAGIEPARHSLPNSPISSTFAQEATDATA